MMTDAVALAKERSAAKTSGFWYKFKIGFFVFVKYLSLVFVAFMMLLPLVSCFVTAAKTDKEYHSTSVMDMPKNWLNFDNYVQAFTTIEHGSRIPQLHHRGGCSPDRHHDHRHHACLRVEPFPLPPITPSSVACHHRGPASGHRNAGRAVQNDGQLPRSQHDVGIHPHAVRHRRHLHLRIHPILREYPGVHG